MTSLWTLWVAVLWASPVAAPAPVPVIRLDQPLVSERQAFTPAAATLELGRFQIETGVAQNRDEDATDWQLAATKIRFGLPAQWELQVGFQGYRPRRSSPTGGWGGTTLAVKKSWRQPDRSTPSASGLSSSWPTLAVTVSTSLPTGSSRPTGAGAEPAAIVSAEWHLTSYLQVATSYQWRRQRPAAGDSVDQFGAGLLLRWRLSSQWWIDGEYYGVDPKGAQRAEFAALSVRYYWVQDVAFDARWAAGLGGAQPQSSWTVGATVRF